MKRPHGEGGARPKVPRELRLWGLILAMFGVGVGLAWGGRLLYDHLIQSPICFDYARRTHVQNVDALAFVSVKTPGRYDREHACTFWNTRTGETVVLSFEPDAVPGLADVFEGVIVAITFVAGAYGVPLLLDRILARLGIRPEWLYGKPKQKKENVDTP